MHGLFDVATRNKEGLTELMSEEQSLDEFLCPIAVTDS
jgi:hypothetical protein